MKPAAVAGLAALLLATLAGSRDARAQFKDEDEPEAELAGPRVNSVVLNPANLYQWAVGNARADVARTRLEALLTITIDDVDRACGLTDEQKKKLRLAGRGDLKRLWDTVDESIRKYANVHISRDEMLRIHQELQSVRIAINDDPLAGETLFAKTLATMLTPKQMERVAHANATRTAYRYRAKVELVIANLDQTAGLTDAQREQLVTLVLNETKPPASSTRYDYQFAMVQVAKLPEPKLRAIFDDLQCRIVRPKLDQFMRYEAILIQNGVLPGPTGKAPAQPVFPGVLQGGFR